MSIRGLLRGIDLTTMIWRLLILYAVWFLCRISFYLYNAAAIGPLAWAELPSLLWGGLVFDNVSILYVNSLFIVASLAPFRFRERVWYQKGLFWLFIITNAAALVVNVSDNVYFHYVHKRFTADELAYLDNNDNNLAVVLRAMWENFHLLLFWGLLVWGMVWCYRRIKYTPTQINNKWAYFGVNLAILLGTVVLVVGGIRGGFGASTRPLTLSNATLYTPSSAKANLILSNPFCMLRTMGSSNPLFRAEYFDQETLSSIYTPYHYPAKYGTVPSDSASTAPSLGERNIVIFILESFSSEHSALLNPDLYPDGQGFTPFLDSLMRGGYYFTNAYASGHKSIDALPSVLSSIPSYKTPFVLLPRSISEMESMPAMLREKGYSTSFFNGSPRGSMGFGAYTNLAGVDDYYSMEDYEKARGKKDYDGTWGIWDEPFLQYMAGVLTETSQQHYMSDMRKETPRPFFATVFTLSSHHPFKVPAEYEKTLPEGKTKVHKGVAYTDMSIRRFMETAAKKPWFWNSIFVFVGDHVSSETFAPKTQTASGGIHIMGFIYTPDGVMRGADSSVFSQIDIMPTLLGLIGNKKPYFAFGRDVFNEPERMPVAMNVIGEDFVAVTDSLTVIFDGSSIVQAYNRNDTLERRDVSADRTPYMEKAENEIKARLQQYYEHADKGDYLVK